MSEEYLRCIEPYVVPGRSPRVIRFGDALNPNDPAIKPSNRHRFVSMQEFEERTTGVGAVERTTAAPGEKRNVSIPEPTGKDKAAPPADNAPKSAWLKHAREQGYDGPDSVTTNELKAQYG